MNFIGISSMNTLQTVFGCNYHGFLDLLQRTRMCTASQELMHKRVDKLLLEYSKVHKSKRSLQEVTVIMHDMIDEWFK